MRFNLSTVAVVLATMGLTQASLLLPRNPLYEILNSRQAPPGCDTDCAKVNTALKTCTDAACFCTADVQAGLQTCINCGIKAFYDGCSGYGLKPITLASTSTAYAPTAT